MRRQYEKYPRNPQSVLMTEFVPDGYISVRDAVNRLGPDLFPEEWTGKEYKARRGLISEEEWLKIKDLAPARGGGAPGSAPLRTTIAAPVATAPHRTGDPSSSSYQASTVRVSDTRIHVIDCALRLKLASSKQPSWILSLGSCIEPRLHCGVSMTPIR
jgi:hypothetical protein